MNIKAEAVVFLKDKGEKLNIELNEKLSEKEHNVRVEEIDKKCSDLVKHKVAKDYDVALDQIEVESVDYQIERRQPGRNERRSFRDKGRRNNDDKDTVAINGSGDVLKENNGKGADIASQRLDELDQKAISKAKIFAYREKLCLIDFGAGRCSFSNSVYDQTKKSKGKGNTIVAVDNENFADMACPGVKFVCTNMVNFFDKNQFKPNIIYSQRTIHYLTYPEAKNFIDDCYNYLQEQGYIYISSSGITSELGNNYKDKELPIRNRFCHLSEEMIEKHGIRQKVCLYSLGELVDLLSGAGFKIIESQKSDFGNNKVIAQKQ